MWRPRCLPWLLVGVVLTGCTALVSCTLSSPAGPAGPASESPTVGPPTSSPADSAGGTPVDSADGSPAASQPVWATSGPVLAVKIDNVDGARPATGLGSADVIYVEPVEAGLTRIVAVFATHLPAVVGPVRSARETDLDLLAQYGRPTFAYSGAVSVMLPLLQSAPLVNASPAEVPRAYFRSFSRNAPHNLYVHPGELPLGTGPTPQGVLEFGAAPDGGTPTTVEDVRYPDASYEFRWSAQTAAWSIWMDGTPYLSTEAGQLAAATVVVQRVPTSPEPFAEDSSGALTPIAESVGSGPATVLRDGQSFEATWSRPTPQSPTQFTTSSGEPLPLAAGPVWVLLLPG